MSVYVGVISYRNDDAFVADTEIVCVGDSCSKVVSDIRKRFLDLNDEELKHFISVKVFECITDDSDNLVSSQVIWGFTDLTFTRLCKWLDDVRRLNAFCKEREETE